MILYTPSENSSAILKKVNTKQIIFESHKEIMNFFFVMLHIIPFSIKQRMLLYPYITIKKRLYIELVNIYQHKKKEKEN